MAVSRFVRIAVPGSAEIVYERPVNEGLSVRVFSSVTDRLAGARACGNDAIRVVIWAAKNRIIVSSEKRVHRVRGWRTNLADRIASAILRIEHDEVAACTCGGYWVKRTGKYGEFYGCSGYPLCRRTKRLQ
ncbi:MAG: topoisomerase DNA-binding C4 zinc finger domain-containing protein [bacterium]